MLRESHLLTPSFRRGQFHATWGPLFRPTLYTACNASWLGWNLSVNRCEPNKSTKTTHILSPTISGGEAFRLWKNFRPPSGKKVRTKGGREEKKEREQAEAPTSGSGYTEGKSERPHKIDKNDEESRSSHSRYSWVGGLQIRSRLCSMISSSHAKICSLFIRPVTGQDSPHKMVAGEG